MLCCLEEVVHRRVPMSNVRRCHMQLRLGRMVLREEYPVSQLDLDGLRLYARY